MISARRMCGLLFLTVLSGDIGVFAQIGYPGGGYPGGGYPGGGYPGGGYPGGGYPGGGIGIPMPGRKKKDNKKQDAVPTTTLEGMLRSLTDTQVVLEADDTRLINLKRTANTKFFNSDGDAMKPSDLNPGDHLQIDASEDDSGFFTAVKVNFDKAGTSAERAAASRPVDVGGAQSSQSSGGGGADTDPDPDRPRLRRAEGSAPAEAATPPAPSAPNAPPASAPAATATPVAVKSQTVSKAKADSNGDELIDPRTPSELSSDRPVAAQSDDSDRPQLRRGKPALKRAPAETTEIASSQAPASQAASGQTSPSNQPVAPRAVRPTVTREQEPEAAVPVGPPVDPMIAKAMEAAESFSETLPNYVVQQFTARFVSQSSSPSWQAQDVVSAEVVYENGQESYRNLKINNKPIKKGEEEATGAWSRGEFGTLLRDIFSPATAAEFRYRKESYIAGTYAALYDFTVEHATSHWHIQVSSQSVFPSYKGSVWIDKKNGRVLRIEMQTRNMPGEFPADKVETAADYEYVRIGGGSEQFLLPVHSENLMCFRGSNNCSRNAIDFRNYKKYSGEATITFEK